ncbi:hypothetical protein niasHT_015488 [Heterodera trifolii]|uniref:Uncharacterized protein n=1 Tax=Heterodera trifolii TaxID=157864 RepID=A0ABD2L0F8_9BILA
MALSAWPILFSERDEKNQQQTLPYAKYECAISFDDGIEVPISKEGLLTLIQSGFLRDALFMTTKLLNNIGQGLAMAGRQTQNNQFSLEVWACRFQLMTALRMHSQLLDELTAFGELDSSELFLPNDANELKGSMVPFSLRLLHAEAFSFSPLPYSSMVRVHKLIENTVKAIEIARWNFAATDSELGIWHERLEEAWMAKGRVLFRLKEYSAAFEFYEWIRANSKSAQRHSNVLKMLFLMAMHTGDEQKVVKYLEEFDKNRNGGKDDALPAFKSVFDGNFKEALTQLRRVKAQNDALEFDAQMLNNESVCLLYNGEPVQCVQSLFTHRCDSVAAPLAMNVATVSDLVSTNSAALKQSFLEGRIGNQQQQKRNILFNPAEVMRMQQ